MGAAVGPSRGGLLGLPWFGAVVRVEIDRHAIEHVGTIWVDGALLK
jgi:hypothetical protein